MLNKERLKKIGGPRYKGKKWKDEYASEMLELYRCDYTEQQIAEYFDVTRNTIIRWKKIYL